MLSRSRGMVGRHHLHPALENRRIQPFRFGFSSLSGGCQQQHQQTKINRQGKSEAQDGASAGMGLHDSLQGGQQHTVGRGHGKPFGVRPRRAHLVRGNESGQIRNTPCRRKRGRAGVATAGRAVDGVTEDPDRGGRMKRRDATFSTGMSTDDRLGKLGTPWGVCWEGLRESDSIQQGELQWCFADGRQQEVSSDERAPEVLGCPPNT